jgi:alpha-glucan phosphorylase-like protein
MVSPESLSGQYPGMNGLHPKELMESTVDREKRSGTNFLDAISRPDLKEVITRQTPWSYWTMELYGEGIKGQGGLGILAADTVRIARDVGLPMVCVTPFYTIEESQKIENFEQKEVERTVSPVDRGFDRVGETFISTVADSRIPLGIYKKSAGCVEIVAVSEPNLGKLYQGRTNDDHRLYQEVVLGFGGFRALKQLGVKPSMNQQLNEAPTVFAALARLDERIQEIQQETPEQDPQKVFNLAFAQNKEKTIYTNHTREQAAEAEFRLDQFERFVIPNLQSESVKAWLRGKIEGKGGSIKLSILAIELSGKRNGVSLLHARVASETYKDYDGNLVTFEGITNGISDYWIDPELIEFYRLGEIRDEFGRPTEDFRSGIEILDSRTLRTIKSAAKLRLREFLQSRVDQYGNPINIPENEKIFNWKRRIARYKQPWKLFEDPLKLAEILQNEHIHIVMSGRAHSTDDEMKRELTRIWNIIDQNTVLKERVHFIEDYDLEVGLALVQGADASINTPTVIDKETGKRISTEACGTSWMKDIANNTVLTSVEDGGVADVRIRAETEGRIATFKPAYLQVIGVNREEEITSLYDQIQKAAAIIDGKDPQTSWDGFVKDQLGAYLPVISGSRMEAQYINFGIPVVQAQVEKPIKVPNYGN